MKVDQQIANEIILLFNSGTFTKKDLCRQFNLSWSCIYTIVTGKRYQSKRNNDGINLKGLTKHQKLMLTNISKNKDISRNTLILRYIKTGINLEPERNKIYED